MSAPTPTKRRALGALNANALTRSPSRVLSAAKLATNTNSPAKSTPAAAAAAAATATTPSPKKKKRALEGAPAGEVASPAFKKLCSVTDTPSKAASPVKATAVAVMKPEPRPSVQGAEEESPQASLARRSFSPDASSLFDNSTINTSQFTTITEPDASAHTLTTTAATVTSATAVDNLSALPPPRPRRVPPTREEFRQRAEILRLRLSLASYKVKTNQTDVPLDKLQVRPVPGIEQFRRDLQSMSTHPVERPTAVQYWYRSLPSVAAPAPLLPSASHQTAGSVEEEEEDDDEEEEKEEEAEVGASSGGAAVVEAGADETTS